MTWEEFKAIRLEELATTENNRYTETIVECPECGAHLFRDEMVILTCCPPQRRYICRKCNWVGCTY